MQKMLHGLQTWRLEQNDRLIELASDSSGVVFHDTSASSAARHAHPVWRIVVGLEGDIVIDGAQMAGAVVPPQTAQVCRAPRGFLALYLDAWTVAGPSQITALTPAFTDVLRRAWRETAEPAALFAEVAAKFGRTSRLDARLVEVLSRIDSSEPISVLAAQSGLSAPRLRTLVRQTAGVPLVGVRQWRRLRTAMLSLGVGPLGATAAESGYADQAHFTRSTVRFLGRTPGSIISY